jgi:malonate transporter and related proteins
VISFLLLCTPVFALVALGWAAIAARLMPHAAIDALGSFSFRFALPALVFQLIGREPLASLFEPVFLAGYLASGCLLFALTFAVFRNARPARASARATTATVSNLGFLGPPLILAFFGPRGAGPLAMAIVSEVMIIMSIGAVIMVNAGDNDRGIGPVLIKGTIGNPVIVAIALGAGIALAGVALPAALDRFLTLLGSSAAPTALFAVGGALAALRIDRTTVRVAAIISLVKLVLYPLTVWCILTLVLKLDEHWSSAGTLIAALPSAGSNFVLAQNYTDDADGISAVIVLSTLVSVVTVPVIAWLMIHP